MEEIFEGEGGKEVEKVFHLENTIFHPAVFNQRDTARRILQAGGLENPVQIL